MIQISATSAPLFIAVLVLCLLGTAAWILAFRFRGREDDTTQQTLAEWRPEYLERLQTDGRWSLSQSPFKRSIECILYAPEARSGGARKMPRAARLQHRVRAIGPWILQSTTRLQLAGSAIELNARSYLEMPLQFGLAPRQWEVLAEGQVIGTLTRDDEAIIARNLDGQLIGRWNTPTAPGRMRHPAPSPAEATTPWYTALDLSGEQVELRLPFFDGRQHPYDFGAIPFLRGASVSSLNLPWALAFLAFSAQAGLTLRTHTPRRSA